MYRKIKINYSRLLIKNFVSKKMMEYISNVLKFKKKNCQPRITYTLKILFLNEGKVKTFPDTRKAELIHS